MNLYTVGVDLGGTNMKAGLFDLNYRNVVERSISTEAHHGPIHVLQRISDLVAELFTQANVHPSSVQCMGIGIPGLLDPTEGLSIFSPNFPEWADVHVVNFMKTRFDFPVFIDNDVRVNLYGEWKFGAGIGYSDIVLITLGTGLGSGMVSGGRVVYGATSSAGEIGHMNMYRNGRPCRCGSSGCLGRYVSAVGMVNTFKNKLSEGRTSIIESWIDHDTESITAQMISEAYDSDDPLAIEVMHETGEILGYGLANVVNLINPQVIIVGGGMAAAGERLLRTVREVVQAHALSLSSTACKIVEAELGVRSGLMGSAYYALEKLGYSS